MTKIKVKSDLSELNKIRFFIRKNIRLSEISEKEFYIIELSLLEICINIIRYAYPGKKGSIYLKIWQEKSKFYFEIKDDGIPFNPTKVKKPDIEEIMTSGKKGGLGVYLTLKLMDGFSYKRENEQNVLTIYKKISSA
jgi:anti-sigma regulatory factor (Ser/Thr protein kinase)